MTSTSAKNAHMTDNRTTERVDHSPRVREAIDELMREKDATDSQTTELRISEPLRGFIRHQSNRAYIDGGQARWLTDIADKIDAKHEQAVAATLGSEREKRLEKLARSLYASYYDEWPDRAEEVYAERMKELGIEVG